MQTIPRFDFVNGSYVRRGDAQVPVADNPAWRTPEGSGERILVKRGGMYHVVDPQTRCATISMGKKEARSLLGKLRPQAYPHPIHTMLGTMMP